MRQFENSILKLPLMRWITYRSKMKYLKMQNLLTLRVRCHLLFLKLPTLSQGTVGSSIRIAILQYIL